jgi:hypothetical protein
MTPGGLPYAAAWVCWAVSFLASSFLLLRVTPPMPAGRVIRLAAAALLGAVLLLVLAMLAMRGITAQPSSHARSLLLSTFFTVAVLAMTNIGAALSKSIAGRIATFHRRRNSANLHRSPISFFLEHRPSLERAAAMFFWLGSGQMLYGAWFDMRAF